jgi:hypothetical protein
MTKEEARLTLQENFGYLSEGHPRIIEAMKVAMNILSQPSLPANLDEAARKYGHEEPILPEGYNDGDIPLYERWTADAFKAGAEWLAGQGETVSGIITKVGDKLDVETTEYLIPEESEFERCDKVIVQIRKKL